MLQVTTIKLGNDEKKWNHLCWMFQIPLGGGVGIIGGVMALLSLILLPFFCRPRVWLKETSTKTPWYALEEGGLVIFSLNFPFSLEENFHLPPSTYVPIKLAKVSMKKSLILSLKGISKVGVLSFKQLRYQPHWRNGK